MVTFQFNIILPFMVTHATGQPSHNSPNPPHRQETMSHTIIPTPHISGAKNKFTPKPCALPTHTSSNPENSVLLTPSLLGPPPLNKNNLNPIINMQQNDEIANIFATIAPTRGSRRRINVPLHITATRDWSLSCLARVITDRPVFDGNFTTTMMTNWEAHPATRISPIAQRTYLIDFACPREMQRILRKEPWHYRGDIVSMRKVNEPSQLTPTFVNHVSLWTQFHNVPPELLSAEGILHLAQDLGTPVSEVTQGYNAGRLFMRVKIAYDASEPLDDTMELIHPTREKELVYLVYERATRLCSYCGEIGHELAGCASHGRVLQLCADPANSHRQELRLLRDHRKGEWMNCPTLVPRPTPPTTTDPSSNSSSPRTQQHHANTPPFSPAQQQPEMDHLERHVSRPDHASPLNSRPVLENLITQPPQEVNQSAQPIDQSTNPPPYNPDQPRYSTGPRSLRNRNIASSSTSLTTRTHNLSIRDADTPTGNHPDNNEDLSPPPGYHKRLRAASPESPSGDK